MEYGSAGLPRLWPAHAGLAEDGLRVLEQYHIVVDPVKIFLYHVV